MTYTGANRQWEAGYLQYLKFLSDGIFIFPATDKSVNSNPIGGNLALSGTTPASWADRATTIGASVGSGVLIFGGIENSSESASQDWAHFQTVIEACPTARRIYICPAAPTKGSFSRGKTSVFNSLASAYCNSHSNQCRFLSKIWTSPNVINLAFNSTTNGPDSYDGTHQNSIGSRKQAENIWLEMSDDWSSDDAFSNYRLTDNLFSASYAFPGDTQGRADNITIIDGSAGATLTPSKDTITYRGVSYVAQALTVSGSATAIGSCSIRRSSFPASFNARDTIDLICLVEISNSTGNGVPIGLRTLDVYTYSDKIGLGSTTVPTLNDLSPAIRITPHVVRTQQYNVIEPASGGSSLTFDFTFTLNTGVESDIRIKIARLACFNRTALGL